MLFRRNIIIIVFMTKITLIRKIPNASTVLHFSYFSMIFLLSSIFLLFFHLKSCLWSLWCWMYWLMIRIHTCCVLIMLNLKNKQKEFTPNLFLFKACNWKKHIFKRKVRKYMENIIIQIHILGICKLQYLGIKGSL